MLELKNILRRHTDKVVRNLVGALANRWMRLNGLRVQQDR